MKYYLTTTANAQSISTAKATAEGCGPVTKYWWGSALCFSDDETVSYTTVDALPDGWLPADIGA